MIAPLIVRNRPVTLVGPATVRKEDFDRARARSDTVVAADGGAEKAIGFGVLPDLVIGDFDSFDPRGRVPDDRLVHVREQDSTDFEKCLDRIDAPLVIALGFLGRRVDHSLAVLSALVARPPAGCVLVGGHDVAVHSPAALRLALPGRSRLSLFPLRSVTGRSEGLQWPIDGLDFAPGGRIGTSNRVTGPVALEFDGPGMLLILPRDALAPLLAALGHG